MVRIVDPGDPYRVPGRDAGEIWVHGDNVAIGYWGQAGGDREHFRRRCSPTPPRHARRALAADGDLGFISDGELFIVGRIKDLLIVYGRNHSPDDIEATIQEITGAGRGDIGRRTGTRRSSSRSSS